jgi:hypothetical protein
MLAIPRHIEIAVAGYSMGQDGVAGTRGWVFGTRCGVDGLPRCDGYFNVFMHLRQRRRRLV